MAPHSGQRGLALLPCAYRLCRLMFVPLWRPLKTFGHSGQGVIVMLEEEAIGAEKDDSGDVVGLV